VRLAADSLIVYVECEPGSGSGVIIWLEPPWHLASSESVLVGSCQGGHHETKDLSEAATGELLKIVELPITSLNIDSRSNDLALGIGEHYLLRTFVSDPSARENWHIRNVSERVWLYASPTSMWVESEKS
jgi:hypothetical protein